MKATKVTKPKSRRRVRLMIDQDLWDRVQAHVVTLSGVSGSALVEYLVLREARRILRDARHALKGIR